MRWSEITQWRENVPSHLICTCFPSSFQDLPPTHSGQGDKRPAIPGPISQLAPAHRGVGTRESPCCWITVLNFFTWLRLVSHLKLLVSVKYNWFVHHSIQELKCPSVLSLVPADFKRRQGEKYSECFSLFRGLGVGKTTLVLYDTSETGPRIPARDTASVKARG